jgi:hypothetical protein
MGDALPSFRTPAEQAAYAAVLADLVGRDRGNEASIVFREPINSDAAVVADAMIRAGSVSDALYARLLAAADRYMLHHRSCSRARSARVRQAVRGHDTKVSFAYARSEQNVSANPLLADFVLQPVKTVRCRTL